MNKEGTIMKITKLTALLLVMLTGAAYSSDDEGESSGRRQLVEQNIFSHRNGKPAEYFERFSSHIHAKKSDYYKEAGNEEFIAKTKEYVNTIWPFRYCVGVDGEILRAVASQHNINLDDSFQNKILAIKLRRLTDSGLSWKLNVAECILSGATIVTSVHLLFNIKIVLPSAYKTVYMILYECYPTEGMIRELSKSPLVRNSACIIIPLAFCATSITKAIWNVFPHQNELLESLSRKYYYRKDISVRDGELYIDQHNRLYNSGMSPKISLSEVATAITAYGICSTMLLSDVLTGNAVVNWQNISITELLARPVNNNINSCVTFVGRTLHAPCSSKLPDVVYENVGYVYKGATEYVSYTAMNVLPYVVPATITFARALFYFAWGI